MAVKAIDRSTGIQPEKLSKAELIKAIKKLQARETKLLNQVAKLEAQVAHLPSLTEGALVALAQVAPGGARKGRVTITHVEPGEVTESNLVDDPAPCAAFPWEKK